MKREDILKQFPEATKEQIDALLDINSQDIGKAKADTDDLKQQAAAKDTEIAGLKEQIAQRDADIKQLQDSAKDASAIQQQLSELQGKYKTDTETLNKRLADQAKEFGTTRAMEKIFAGVEFSSPLARDAAMAQFRDKGFTLDDKTGTLIGGQEWLDQLRKDMPEAFKAAEPKEPEPQLPSFGGSVSPKQPAPQGGQGNGGGLFGGWNFNAVRQVKDK